MALTHRTQTISLSDTDVDEIISAARMLVARLTDGQLRRLKRGRAYVVHVDARSMRRLVDVLHPIGIDDE